MKKVSLNEFKDCIVDENNNIVAEKPRWFDRHKWEQGEMLVNAFNEHDVLVTFSKVGDSKATKALQFYEDCADNLPYYQTSEKDNGFDWDRCRAYCRVGKSYSHQRFMAYVAEWFGTTVKEMKLQWRNVKYTTPTKR